jgi:biotin/lipoyl-binding protein
LQAADKKLARPLGPPPVTVAQPVKRTITEWDEFTGRFEAIEEVQVRARVGGFVTSVEFKDGDMVRTGDLLYLIDSRPFRAQHQVEMFHSSDEMDSGVSRPVSKMVVDASRITEPSTARLALCSGLSKWVRLLFLLVGTR